MLGRILKAGVHASRPSYNSVRVAGDGNVYYIISTAALTTGAHFVRYSPSTGAVDIIADLNVACGYGDVKVIPQGKCHVPLYEVDGTLYFATHTSHYAMSDGVERLGSAPEGWGNYPGGYILQYDISTGQVRAICQVPDEGIITMAMDTRRQRIFALTWPSGQFVAYDLRTNAIASAPACGKGETGTGLDYRIVCRSIVVDDTDGCAYFTTSEGNIVGYSPTSNTFRLLAVDMRRDYFGVYDCTSPLHMRYHWRQAVWHPQQNVIYAVHASSGYLVRIDPRAAKIEVMERLTADSSRRIGMFDRFSNGYLGFTLTEDGTTLYYLTGGALETEQYIPSSKLRSGMQGPENVHVVSYDLRTNTRRDLGYLQDETGLVPTHVQSAALAPSGAVLYTLATIPTSQGSITELMEITLPNA